MLVLSRKSGECITIGGSIEVKVIDICGGRVRLGFSAPGDVNIRRQELRRACVGQFAVCDPCDAATELFARK